MSDTEGNTAEASSTAQTTGTTNITPIVVNSSSSAAFPIQGIQPPRPLDVEGNIADNWKAFKQAWSNYPIIMNVNTQPESYKVALFLHCVGPEALKIFNGMSFSKSSDREKVECIIAKFDEFTIGEVNETYERYVFNSRNQSPEESIDAYIAIIRTLAQTCNFCDCRRDSLIRDRIVLGVCNPQTRKRLLQERKLTLNKCIDICRSSESTASQLNAISVAKTTEDVHQVNRRPEKPRATNNTRESPRMSRMARLTSHASLATSVVEITRSFVDNVQRGGTHAASVEEETTSSPNSRSVENLSII